MQYRPTYNAYSTAKTYCSAVQCQYSAYASLFVTAAGVAVHPTDQCRVLALLHPTDQCRILALLHPTDHTLALMEEEYWPH